ncbi:HpcH/HpaI aldolase/citrate lyase family protein [Chloroflexota bacterium]
MIKNRIKEKISRGELAIGTYVRLSDPAVVEIIGLAGYDAAFIDMEHAPFDIQLVEQMIRACDLVGIVSLVRVPDNNPSTILRLLESGAQGIQVPHIGGVEDAEAVVKAVRYAPLGLRGVGAATRASRYGAVPMAEHKATSNEEILLAVMVEDMEAVRQIGEIASVEGVDIVAIGPTDLSQALGVDTNDPLLKHTIEDISQTLKMTGKAKMALPFDLSAYPVSVAELKKLGVAYTNCGPADVSRLMNSYRQQVQEIQSQL